jgi:NAD(P)-dependent dehydrogenase (short-subunit alcohol dehydrogenase family)
MLRFIDKVIIVTGSARGIGWAIVVGFGSEGAKVVVADIRDNLGKNTAEQINKGGGHAVPARTWSHQP